jgi:hypothetical protein
MEFVVAIKAFLSMPCKNNYFFRNRLYLDEK